VRLQFSTFGPKYSTAATALNLIGLFSLGQALSPGEVQINGGPYRPESQVLRAESRLVEVEVVVRDKRGRAVGGFTKHDFAIFDSGHQRDLAEFSAEKFPETGEVAGSATPNTSMGGRQPVTPKPVPNRSRWIGLVFDDLNTPPGDLARAKVAARRFVAEAVTGGDWVAVFTTSAGRVLQFTTDRDAIIKSVMALQSHPRKEAAGLAACPRITAYEAYQIVKNDPIAMQAKVAEACQCDQYATQMSCDPNQVATVNPSDLLNPLTSPYKDVTVGIRAQAQATWNQARFITQTALDAVRAAVEQLAPMPGRRVLLFVSSGFLSGDVGEQRDEITNEALHAGVVIDSLESKGLYAEAPGRPLNETSATLPNLTMFYEARSLGDRLESEDSAMASFAESTGGLFFRSNNDLDLGFYELGVAPEYAYELGFQPDQDGKYHKIKVVLASNSTGDFVQARPGYFAPARESSEPTAQERIDAEVRASEERNDFPLTVTSKPLDPNGDGPKLNVQTKVGIQKLPFKREGDRHIDLLTFIAALFNRQGKMISAEEGQVQLALKAESFRRFTKTGLSTSLSLKVPAGSYRLRVVVEEVLRGKMSATTQTVQVQ
jgi:VWFA-related protein